MAKQNLYNVHVAPLQPGGWCAEIRRGGVMIGLGIYTGDHVGKRGLQLHNAAARTALASAISEARREMRITRSIVRDVHAQVTVRP